MPDRRRHTLHLLPLLDHELAFDLSKEERLEWPVIAHLLEQIEPMGERVPDARGKAKAEQGGQGKDMVGDYLDKSITDCYAGLGRLV